MPGPWQKGGSHLGSVLEGGVFDRDGNMQGTVVAGVRQFGSDHRGQPMAPGFCIAGSDALICGG